MKQRFKLSFIDTDHTIQLCCLLVVLFTRFTVAETVTITNEASTGMKILSWDDCVKTALECNPSLISARESVNQSDLSKKMSVSGLLPQVNGGVNRNHSKQETADANESYSYSVNASQLIFDGGKKKYDIAKKNELISSSEFGYEISSSNVRLDLRTGFIGLLRAQELVKITEGILTRRRQATDLIRLRYEAGREHRGSLLTSEAKLAQAELEVSQAHRNLDIAQRNLFKTLGWSKFIPVRVDGDLRINIALESNPAFEDIARNTPFLQQLITREKAAELALKAAKANYLPDIKASASAGAGAPNWPPDSDQWSVGVSLSIPIFEGGRIKQEVASAYSGLISAGAEVRSGEQEITSTLHTKWVDVRDAMEVISVREKFLEASRERAKIAEAQYSTGLLSFDNWIIIEDDQVSAEKALLEAQAGALTAEARWQQVNGRTLENEAY